MSTRPIAFAADGFEIVAHERRELRARTLLAGTSRSVMDIAAEVGMTHSHFSRIFARRLGVSPTEFRRINRQ